MYRYSVHVMWYIIFLSHDEIAWCVFLCIIRMLYSSLFNTIVESISDVNRHWMFFSFYRLKLVLSSPRGRCRNCRRKSTGSKVSYTFVRLWTSHYCTYTRIHLSLIDFVLGSIIIFFIIVIFTYYYAARKSTISKRFNWSTWMIVCYYFFIIIVPWIIYSRGSTDHYIPLGSSTSVIGVFLRISCARQIFLLVYISAILTIKDWPSSFSIMRKTTSWQNLPNYILLLLIINIIYLTSSFDSGCM